MLGFNVCLLHRVHRYATRTVGDGHVVTGGGPCLVFLGASERHHGGSGPSSRVRGIYEAGLLYIDTGVYAWASCIDIPSVAGRSFLFN
jgi:hypothetical protein